MIPLIRRDPQHDNLALADRNLGYLFTQGRLDTLREGQNCVLRRNLFRQRCNRVDSQCLLHLQSVPNVDEALARRLP